MSDFFNTRDEAEAIDTMLGATFKLQTEEEADQFFGMAQNGFDDVGFKDAADNMRQYRSGSERHVCSPTRRSIGIPESQTRRMSIGLALKAVPSPEGLRMRH